MSRIWVNVYEVERCYGGPEEGGWWYDYIGRCVARRRVNVNRVELVREVMWKRWPDSGYRFSMRPSGDDFTVMVEHHKGTDYRHARVPHYE